MATLATIEQLARHLHELYLASPPGQARIAGGGSASWADLADDQQEGYRAVAAGLLLRPPGWLKKAMR